VSSVAKVILILVLVGFLFCGGIVALVWYGGNWAINKFKDEVARSNEWTSFGVLWRGPPADADAARLFPAQVAGFALSGNDRVAGIPELGINLAGRRAIYQRDKTTIEVYVWRATAPERDAAYKSVASAVEARGGLRGHVQVNARLKYSASNPADGGVFWGDGQWLFLARTTSDEDMDKFLRSYLEAIAEKGPPPQGNKATGRNKSSKP
jgi:hypothetical protein